MFVLDQQQLRPNAAGLILVCQVHTAAGGGIHLSLTCCLQAHDNHDRLQQENRDLKTKEQQQTAEVASAVARAEKLQHAATEAFAQAAAHARSAQQAQARCDVLEQTVEKAVRRVEAVGRLQQV